MTDAPPARYTAYRMLTGPDDSSFCHRVTAALAAGWRLHGSPSLTYDPATNRVICGQAIVKDAEGAYDPGRTLSEA